MSYSLIKDQCAVFNWSNGETLNREDIVDELNKLAGELSDVYCWIDDKIDELEEKEEFGKKYGFCKMHSIRFAIDILTELKGELKKQ